MPDPHIRIMNKKEKIRPRRYETGLKIYASFEDVIKLSVSLPAVKKSKYILKKDKPKREP